MRRRIDLLITCALESGPHDGMLSLMPDAAPNISVTANSNREGRASRIEK